MDTTFNFYQHTINVVPTTSGKWVAIFYEHWNDDYTMGGFNNGVTPPFLSKIDAVLYAMKEINQWIEDEYSTHKEYLACFL